MPTYPYECPKCESQFDVIKSFDEIDNIAECPNCGMLLDKEHRRIGRVYFGGEKPFNPYFCPGLGSVVHSENERKRLAKDRGLEEIGNEPIEKIHKHFDSRREEKCKERWDELTKPIEVMSNGGDP